MRFMSPTLLCASSILISSFAQAQDAADHYKGWQHSGSLMLLTTPEGANLPASAVVEAFPVLVRLHKDWFDFSQAKPKGDDIRFSSAAGVPLPFQIEQWDVANGTASIWVRLPVIKGNARQELHLHWGKSDAVSESNGSTVFNADNGFAAVMHMNEEAKDELGTVKLKDLGTTAAVGMIGECRHLVPGKGIDGGSHVIGLPFGDSSFTTEAWFRTQGTDSMIVYWGRYAQRLNGKTGDGNEIDMGIGSPLSLYMATDGPGGVKSDRDPVVGQWYHVAATYDNGTSLYYVNGKQEGKSFHKAAMSLMKDLEVKIGGMRNGNYRFEGDIDEVRISKVARSADWAKLQYENQNAMQTLVGPLMQKGSEFSLSQSEITMLEGKSVTVTAKAGGAQKIYWIIKREGVETLAAVDRYSFTLPAGRVSADTSMTLQMKAVFANEVKTKDIPVKITEDIPEPVITVKAPTTWNGRDTIEAKLDVSNLAAMKVKGAGEVSTKWSVLGGAVTKEVSSDTLILKRSQFSGKITVKAVVSNGGADSIATATIQVTEPKSDAWVQRVPAKDEKPDENQFYARDDKNEGTLFYNGTLTEVSDAVFLKLYADDKVIKTENQKLAADKAYAFAVKLKPGLITYKVEFGAKIDGVDKVLKTVSNLICGDAYIIDGQSNAEATGENNGKTTDPISPYTNWLRSYGNQHTGETKGGWVNAVRSRIWGKPDYGVGQIGAWGMVLGNGLVEKHKIPICIINGAVGGTRIDQHQPNPKNRRDTSGENAYANPYKIYGCLLTRVEGAKLTHGIRGVLWHQGENNQGSASPTGDYDWKSYQQYFIDMSAAWKQDFPNIKYYYIYQVWPNGCNMGGGPAGDMLLDVQRTLPSLFSNMRIMSTLGIKCPSSGRGLCHFDPEGYAQIATLMSPVVEQDNYGLDAKKIMSAPNLKRVYYTNVSKTELGLEYGQPMAWTETSKTWFLLDGASANMGSAKVVGNTVIVTLTAPATAKTLSYVSGGKWDGRQDKLLYGTNGIAALTCSAVIIEENAK